MQNFQSIYRSDVESDWCPGCGDFGILSAITQALGELEIPPWKCAIFSGIGCSGKTPHFINAYGIHTLHGRPLPFAIGAKMANPSLTVIAISGDGDGYGIGAGHFVNAGRRNVDITYIVHNNGVYGLTKGQASPTLKRGVQPKSLKYPNLNDMVNPIALALASGYSFVARGFAYNVKHLKEIIKQAVIHKGLALIDVLQPCPVFNTVDTKEKYMERIKILDGNEFPTTDIKKAFEKALDEENLWIGIFYKNPEKQTYEERYSEILSSYPSECPANLKMSDEKGNPTTDISEVLNNFLC
ncbi:2-oxoglutarate oxidoreductase subunit KorB [bacterium HR19]|nr:2-oxoglutarate oxidoreductase subunit KorB [bacterium HR19]